MGRIKAGLVSVVCVSLLFVTLFGVVLNVRVVKGDSGTIYIRADGSIEPTTPIFTLDNVTYTFADNINSDTDGIVVERSNIIIDGNGYMLQGLVSGSGFYLYAVNNVTIKNTNINNFSYGMYLYGSSNNSVFGNNIKANNFYGIYLSQSSSNNIIYFNNLTNNVHAGIHLWALCNYNSIYGNIMTNNNYYGVHLSASSANNSIYANSIANNYYGVGIWGSGSLNNKVYRNDFINNGTPVDIWESVSIWDDGYPSGGNFWSNYAGVDKKSGPNQDQAGSDGIGDTPYVIFGLNPPNSDRYPLMVPTETYISVPYHSQTNGYYCGPAALEMVFDFYGPGIPQPEIADVARTAADGTYTSDMIRAAHFSNLSTSVGNEMPESITGYTSRKLGYAAFEYSPMTMNDLKSLIAAGYPIIVLTTWHFRVAIGYNSTHITFQDSYYGEMFNMTYQEFDTDWDYSGHWGLLVAPWKIEVSALRNVFLGSVFNVTASVTYPSSLPFNANQYPASAVNATVILPAGLSLVSGETTKKTIDAGTLVAGTSVNVTWAVQVNTLGNYTISVEAEGKVNGSVPSLPSYPEPYNYEDRIGGFGQSAVTAKLNPDETPPTTSNDYDDLWHTSDFAIILTATDDLSGVAQTYYKINDGPTKIVSADGQPLITTEGADNKLEYWSIDKAGNEELPHKILTGIRLDKTCPTIDTPSRTSDGDVLPDQSVKVSVNVTDALSQVKNITLYYTLNNGTTWEEPIPMNYNFSTGLYEATIPGQQQVGTWVRFKIVAYDHAGNNATLDGTESYCVYQVIPEFPSSLILPISMIATLLAVIVYRRKHQRD